MTKTEKLTESLAEMLWNWEEPVTKWKEKALPEYVKEGRRHNANQILKVCKESGLMFVDYGEKEGHFTEPIEVTNGE